MPLRIGESKFDPTILKASSLFEKYPELKVFISFIIFVLNWFISILLKGLF